eukprot:12091999-Prorocentrum_lima.AAC.1
MTSSLVGSEMCIRDRHTAGEGCNGPSDDVPQEVDVTEGGSPAGMGGPFCCPTSPEAFRHGLGC